MSDPTPAQALLLLFVALAAATDLARRKIPNLLVMLGLGAALAISLPRGAGLVCLAGALTGFLLFLPLYLMRGMAAGDVKLMAMVGAFAGPALTLQIAFATCLIGGVMALGIVLYRGRLRDAVANVCGLLAPWLPELAAPAPGPSVGGMPYGVAIALGTLMLVLWQLR